MATREDYRDQLVNKIVGIEDSGYGDFEFSTSEYNTYLELSVARLFPSLWKPASQPAQAVTAYGDGCYGKVDFVQADRVYLVEDSSTLDVVREWETRAGRIMRIDVRDHSEVDLHFYEAYVMPADDVTDAGIPAEFAPLVVHGALIEAMESRQDTGVRGDEPWPNGFQHTTLLDRLTAKFEVMKEEMAMNLPVVQR